MKKTLGIIAMGLIFSVPAYAQGRSGGFTATAGGGPNGLPNTNNGGGIGGGAIGGGSRANIQTYPKARFATAALSGGDPLFAPSSFLSFEQAVEVGKAELAPRKSLAQVAIENTAASKTKSRIEFVQDNGGNVVPLHR